MSKDRKQKTENRRQKKILIVRLDRIGDVILSTPTIKAIREHYPYSHIAFLVRPYCRDVIEGNPYVDETIVYDKDLGFAEDLKLIVSLRGKKFDLAVILHPTKRTHMLTFLAGIPNRVGYDRKWGSLLTKRIPHSKQLGLKHEIDYTLDILRYIGIEPKDRTLHVPMKKSSEDKITEIFSAIGIKKDDIKIAINPGASCPSKRWMPENFARTGDILAARHKAKVIIISDLKDKVFADKVASLMKNDPLDLSGQTSVADVASILKRCQAFISNDSGPVHIACAVGTPVVAIFGRSDRGLSPQRWGPTGKRDIVLHKYVGCKSCLAHNCKLGFKCLEAITVDEVVAAADKILSAT